MEIVDTDETLTYLSKIENDLMTHVYCFYLLNLTLYQTGFVLIVCQTTKETFWISKILL